jgi:hypothetical protein
MSNPLCTNHATKEPIIPRYSGSLERALGAGFDSGMISSNSSDSDAQQASYENHSPFGKQLQGSIVSELRYKAWRCLIARVERPIVSKTRTRNWEVSKNLQRGSIGNQSQGDWIFRGAQVPQAKASFV